MFARMLFTHKLFARLAAALALVSLAACDMLGPDDGNYGRRINPSRPVEVALLVPGGTEQEPLNQLAQSFENAARLAIADLRGASIDLRVYTTAGGDPAEAARAATLAVDEGAKIILGPLFGEAAAAAGTAVVGRNVNLLAFSNNPAIAGQNVYVLGATFDNTAARLVEFAQSQGIERYMVMHAEGTQGEVGRDAIVTAISNAGATLVGVESYPFSQQGIYDNTELLVTAVAETQAQAVFTPAGANADLSILATALPDGGMSDETRFIGLTRWDTLPQLAALPGLEGGLFALPDQGTSAQFEERYQATYGSPPHALAGLAYDGIAAIGALVASGNRDALTAFALTQSQGFMGTAGIFRLTPDGRNERALAVATFSDNEVLILEQAPRRFGSPGL